MTYTNDYLVNKAINGSPIGKWKGTDVIPISKEGYETLYRNGKMNSNFYLIYDYGMKIVNSNRKIIGKMDRNGNIENLNEELREVGSKIGEQNVSVAAKEGGRNSSSLGYTMESVLNDVDDLLKEACAWSF